MGAIGKSGGQPVHEAILKGIMSEFGVIFDMHLLQNPGTVRIDGADTHRKSSAISFRLFPTAIKHIT